MTSRTVALAGAVLGMLAAQRLAAQQATLPSAILLAAMAAIALEDARRMRVPDAWSLAALAGGLLARWLAADAGAGFAAAADGILGMALCGGALLLVREAFYRLRGLDGLGLGDVKLAAAGGAWLGFDLFAVALAAAACAALAVTVARAIAARTWPADRRIPFALYLAPAIWLCWFTPRFLAAG